MAKRATNCGLTIILIALVILIVATSIVGFFPQLFENPLVGQRVLPGFVPENVTTIQIDGVPVISKEDGHWRIVPFDGYPANEDLIQSNLLEVANMTVCAVKRGATHKRKAMRIRHRVAFLDEQGIVIGNLVLGLEHVERYSGFVDSFSIPIGKYLEVGDKVVLVKPVLAPFTGRPGAWIGKPVLMMPDHVYAMHWRNRYAPIVSIEYNFDGEGFRMEKDSEGKLALTYASGVEELLFWEPSYRFRISFQRIESLEHFNHEHKGERMASGSLTICTTDGTNTYSSCAKLYRGTDDTGYVILGNWVYVKESWDTRTWFPARRIPKEE
jgi:hypothetical protein